MSELRELAEQLLSVDPPDAELVAARTRDAVGCHMLASATREAAHVRALSERWGGGPFDRVAERVAITRLSELDDIHMRSCTTVGSVVIPTAISGAAALGSSAVAYRAAVGAGYEAMTRLGVAIDGAHAVYRGIWPTHLCAPFAAAATLARLLELDAERTEQALGIALLRSSGPAGGHDASRPSRWIVLGDAARYGCLAALSAAEGLQARVELERLGALAIDGGLLLAPGTGAAIDAVSVKPFPVAKQCVCAVQAALALAERVDVPSIRRIVVRVPEPYAAMIARAPEEPRLSRLASAPWNIALALERPAELEDLSRTLAPADGPLALARRVEVVADAELSALYPERWPARVEIHSRSGSVFATVIDAAGDPGNELAGALEEKWARLLDGEEPPLLRLAGQAAMLDGAAGRLDAALSLRAAA